jgi:hypothetical protein
MIKPSLIFTEMVILPGTNLRSQRVCLCCTHAFGGAIIWRYCRIFRRRSSISGAKLPYALGLIYNNFLSQQKCF